MMAREAMPVDEFERVQEALPAALAANVPGSGVDHVVVGLPSFSVGETLLAHYAPKLPAMEHRYLNALLMLNRIDCDVVFVCSRRPPPEVLTAYEDIVVPAVADRIRARLHLVVVDDIGPRPLAAKLLDRPDLLDEIRDRVAGRVAVIEPWNVTDHEVAVALALGLPVNGTPPALRSEAFKAAGRCLFRRTGVPVPVGVEGVHTVDDVLDAVTRIRSERPDVAAVVVKHDDSGAGDGNTVVELNEPSGVARGSSELRATVAGLPAWYLDDLLDGGGIVEELVVGDEVRSPSVQLDLLPGDGVRVVATHDQILGGDNGQVYMGCRFPADPAYAPELAVHGEAVGLDLTRRGCTGRAGVDFVAARRGSQPWDVRAIEVNLRKGGTTHPYTALRNLVPGHYDTVAGVWRADAGGTRAYRSTDYVGGPGWTGRPPASVVSAVHDSGVRFDVGQGTGVVLHMLAGLAVDGHFGVTAIGHTPEHAEELFDAMLVAVT